MKQKKAQVEVQFNWIFILIAGAVILLFFGGIVYKQKASSDQQLSVTVLNNLNTIFTATSVSSDTSDVIDVPSKQEITFDCDGYMVSGSKKLYGNKITFSPKTLKGSQIITLTSSWNVPFLVSNFLFLTTPDVRYIFVHNSDPDIIAQLKEFRDKLPRQMSVEMISSGQSIKDEGQYLTRIVFFEVEPDIRNIKIPEKKYSYVRIFDIKNMNDPDNPVTGEFTFQDSKGNNFYGDANLIAVIYSDDTENFNCMIKKASARYVFTSNVYSSKVSLLLEDLKLKRTDCLPYYSSGNDALKTLTSGDNCQNNICSIESTEVLELKSANENLRLKSCPLIY